MKLVAGLGNPGSRYEETRHNVGFMVVERIAQKSGIALKKKGHQGVYGVGRLAGCEVVLLQPHTYMNLSGASIASAMRNFGAAPHDLLVIHDDLDLPFGALRIKVGGGHGGQKGVQHILGTVGTSEFVRLRIGIGRPPTGGDVSSHVLSRFSASQREGLDDLLGTAADAVEVIVSEGPQKAMNLFNNRGLSVSV